MEMGSMKLMMATEQDHKRLLTMTAAEWLKHCDSDWFSCAAAMSSPPPLPPPLPPQTVRDNLIDMSRWNGSSNQRRKRKCGSQDIDRHDYRTSAVPDAPMDLSKRSSNGSSPSAAGMSNVDEDDEERFRENGFGDDDGDGDGTNFDEPLNLSVNGRHSTHANGVGRLASCWNSCPQLSISNANGSSSNNFGNGNGNCNGGGGRGLCGTGPAAPSEHVQKRVRLEEMVSYIRRCSNYADHDDDDGDKQVATDVVDRDRDVAAAVQRSYSCSAATVPHRRKPTTPYKGNVPSSAKPKRTFSRDVLLHQQHCSDPNGSVVPYPVLRQQLLAVDAAQRCKDDDNSYDYDDRGGGNGGGGGDHDHVGSGGAVEGEIAADEENDEQKRIHENNGDILRRQLRLLSSSASSELQWSAYAYYANLLQELQGTLANAVSQSGGPSPGLVNLPPLPSPGKQLASTHSTSPLSDGGRESGTSSIHATTDVDANVAACRKRAPRALTGKHVKHGTGASPSTLLTLRQKIEQRISCQQQVQQQQQQLQPHQQHQQQHQQPHQQRANNHHHQRNGIKADRKEAAHKSSKVSPRKKIT